MRRRRKRRRRKGGGQERRRGEEEGDSAGVNYKTTHRGSGTKSNTTDLHVSENASIRINVLSGKYRRLYT